MLEGSFGGYARFHCVVHLCEHSVRLTGSLSLDRIRIHDSRDTQKASLSKISMGSLLLTRGRRLLSILLWYFTYLHVEKALYVQLSMHERLSVRYHQESSQMCCWGKTLGRNRSSEVFTCLPPGKQAGSRLGKGDISSTLIDVMTLAYSTFSSFPGLWFDLYLVGVAGSENIPVHVDCCGVFSKYQKYVVISRLEIVHPSAVGKEDKDEQMCKDVPRSEFRISFHFRQGFGVGTRCRFRNAEYTHTCVAYDARLDFGEY